MYSSTAVKETSLVSRLLNEAKRDQHKILEYVNSLILPESIHRFVLNYEANFEARDRFLWKWVYAIFRDKNGIMLSTVPDDRVELCAELKVLMTLADVIVDDAADNGKDQKLLDALLKIPFERNAIDDIIRQTYHGKIKLLEAVFEYIFDKFESMPFWKSHSALVEFDIRQVWNSCLYSFLLNQRPSILNYSESMHFSAFNMMIYVYLDIDMIFSRGLDEDEIGAIREVVLKTQEMARIGNWISTWEREINESDLSSGVFARIVTERHLTPNKLERHLKSNDRTSLRTLIKESLIENKLLDDWQEARESALELARAVKSVDMVKYVKGFDGVLKYHMSSVGLK